MEDTRCMLSSAVHLWSTWEKCDDFHACSRTECGEITRDRDSRGLRQTTVRSPLSFGPRYDRKTHRCSERITLPLGPRPWLRTMLRSIACRPRKSLQSDIADARPIVSRHHAARRYMDFSQPCPKSASGLISCTSKVSAACIILFAVSRPAFSATTFRICSSLGPEVSQAVMVT